jgi:hypothetical protein
VDSDDHDEKDHPSIAERRLNKGHAKQHRVGVSGCCAGNDGGVEIPTEQVPRRQMPGVPGRGEARQIGCPDAPRRNAGEIGKGNGPKEQERYRKREDERRKPVSDG